MSKRKCVNHIPANDALNEHVAYLLDHGLVTYTHFSGRKGSIVSVLARRQHWLDAGVSPKALADLSGDVLKIGISMNRYQEARRIAEQQRADRIKQAEAVLFSLKSTPVQSFRVRGCDGLMKVI